MVGPFGAANKITGCAHPCPWGTRMFCEGFLGPLTKPPAVHIHARGELVRFVRASYSLVFSLERLSSLAGEKISNGMGSSRMGAPCQGRLGAREPVNPIFPSPRRATLRYLNFGVHGLGPSPPSVYSVPGPLSERAPGSSGGRYAKMPVSTGTCRIGRRQAEAWTPTKRGASPRGYLVMAEMSWRRQAEAGTPARRRTDAG